MRIVIELNDNDLKACVEQQVGKAVAEHLDALVSKRMKEILDVKLSRVTTEVIDKAALNAATNLIRPHLGPTDYQAKAKAESILAAAARDLIKGVRS